MPNFKKFKFWVQGILPLVYDDSLSYYEVLAKLTGKINELVQYVNTLIRPSFSASVEYGAENNVEVTETEEGYDLKFTLTIPPENEFPSVDAMKAGTSTIPTLGYAKTMSYYNTPYGGGAIYRIYDSAPDGYYELLEDGRYAKLMYDSDVDVKQFGAYGDDTHDDSEAFQNAVNCRATVHVPSGNGEIYLIGETIVVPSTGTEFITGDQENWYGRIHFIDNAYLDVQRYNFGMKYIFMEGESNESRNTYLVKIVNPADQYNTDAKIEKCIFRYAVEAVYSSGRGLRVVGCVFVFCEFCISIAFDGVHNTHNMNDSDVVGGRGFIFKDNRFHSNYVCCIRIRSGSVYLMDICDNNIDGTGRLLYANGVDLYDCNISGNTMGLFSTIPIQIAGNIHGLVIDGNVFANRRDEIGLTLPDYVMSIGGTDYTVEDVIISNNIIRGCNQSAIYMVNALYHHIKVVNNAFTEVGLRQNAVDGCVFMEGANGTGEVIFEGNSYHGSTMQYMYRGTYQGNYPSDVIIKNNITDNGRVYPTWFDALSDIICRDNIWPDMPSPDASPDYVNSLIPAGRTQVSVTCDNENVNITTNEFYIYTTNNPNFIYLAGRLEFNKTAAISENINFKFNVNATIVNTLLLYRTLYMNSDNTSLYTPSNVALVGAGILGSVGGKLSLICTESAQTHCRIEIPFMLVPLLGS